MAERLFGIETEWAFSGLNARGAAVERGPLLRELMRLAQAKWPHLPDGAGRGVFLPNGARFYIDYPGHAFAPGAVGNPEFSSPEVANPWDAVRFVQAGERMLTELITALPEHVPGLTEVVALRCNVDYSGTKNTLGCHESYLHTADPRELPEQLIPHLVSRVSFCGAGGFSNLLDHGLQFTLSPRVSHLVTSISPHSTHSRGIYHLKDESHSRNGYHRCHILCGESLCSEIASWLKVATTALVIALIDGGVRPGDGVRLRSPLQAMRRFASDPTCRISAAAADGSRLTAIAIQRHYLGLAEAHADAPFMPAWTAEACARWRGMLEQLERAPDSVATQLEWAIKLTLFKDRARRRGIPWETVPRWSYVAMALDQALHRVNCPSGWKCLDRLLGNRSPVADEVKRLTRYLHARGLAWNGLRVFLELRQELFEIDVRFGQLGEKGIFAALDRAGVLKHRVPGVDDIPQAVEHPPAVGRARLRGEQVRRLAGRNGRYVCDWAGVWDCEDRRVFDLSEPFATAAEWKPWEARDLDIEMMRTQLRHGIAL